MGDIKDWKVYEHERETAGKIANRRAARSVRHRLGEVIASYLPKSKSSWHRILVAATTAI